jgi:probable F420-dependent oxidoreductase
MPPPEATWGANSVEFGIHIGTRGCLATRENMMKLAADAEANGYAILGVNDHLILPAVAEQTYPYTATGLHPAAQSGECFDALATLAFLAGCTDRIKLLTSVIVVPHRPAVLTAKLFQTVDILSGGRLIAGVGAGWMKAEFDALGAPPFEERGAVTDEYIQAWKTLWTQDRPSMHGKYTQFDNVMFEPKPLSKPHPPIWVGGESNPSIRRAVRHADAWYPASNNNSFLMNTPGRLKNGVERMHRAAEKIGRDPASVDIAYIFFATPEWTPRELPDGGRQMFSGSSDDMLADAAALQSVGVNHLIVYLQRPTIEQTLDVLQRFGEEVVRKAS